LEKPPVFPKREEIAKKEKPPVFPFFLRIMPKSLKIILHLPAKHGDTLTYQ
jgi:hypothetical protein